MKTKSLFLLIPLLLSGCDQTVVKEIGIEELSENLNNPEYIIIDTRPDSLYFGFKDKGAPAAAILKVRCSLLPAGWILSMRINLIRLSKKRGFPKKNPGILRQ